MVTIISRLRVVPHFSSGIVERAKRERSWKSAHARKGDTWSDFHARSRFALRYYPWEKIGGLLVVYIISNVILNIIEWKYDNRHT